MTGDTNERKLEHIRIIQSDRDADRRKYYFDDVRLTHRALPELDLAEVDPSTEFMGKRLSFPLLISSMTGGDHDMLRAVNRNLAVAAEQAGVAMGVGSQRVMFENSTSRESFALRQHAPSALLFANLGAVQLNYGFGLAQCREAVEVVGADALYLHLNPLQEAVQPEGDTNFAGLAGKMAAVAAGLGRPLILKEVGAGISAEDAELAIRAGVRHIDVAGSGGTSWSRIEHHRKAGADSDDLGLEFQDWGIPTPEAIRSLRQYRGSIAIIASGGLRSGIDMAKAMILGASLCGLAQPFLGPAQESPESVLKVIGRLKRQFVTAMFLLGMRTVKELEGNETLLAPPAGGQGGSP
jgi:isopentenyl-diphosphate Delta-isomerase